MTLWETGFFLYLPYDLFVCVRRIIITSFWLVTNLVVLLSQFLGVELSSFE